MDKSGEELPLEGMFSEVAKVQAEAPSRAMMPARLGHINAQTQN
jgi:hypothetical protein